MIVLLVALIGPLLTYIVAAKRLSGRIKNSEASDLWAESRSIRDWSTAQVKELNDQIDRMEIRLTELELKNGELLEENKRLLQQCVHLEHQLEQERTFNSHLRWEAEHSPKRRRTDEHFINEEETPSDDAGNEG